MRDLDFISGRFLDMDVPKDKRYMLRYFRNPLQRAFLRYFLVFGSARNFTDHTGHYCSERLAKRLASRFRLITRVYDDAKRSLTEDGMATVELMERGRLKLTRMPKP
jgi:hypothetical protein